MPSRINSFAMKVHAGPYRSYDKGHISVLPSVLLKKGKNNELNGAKGNHNINANPNFSIDHNIHWLNFAHANIYDMQLYIQFTVERDRGRER